MELIICDMCNGSGEGRTEHEICLKCKGRGTVMIVTDNELKQIEYDNRYEMNVY